MSELRKCQAIKSTGGRCERIVHGDATHCYSHDPARSEARKRAASKAARAKETEVETSKHRLYTQMREALKELLGPDLATEDCVETQGDPRWGGR